MSSEPRQHTQVELEDDGWKLTHESPGPLDPYGHPWNANERIAELEAALRVIEGEVYGRAEPWAKRIAKNVVKVLGVPPA